MPLTLRPPRPGKTPNYEIRGTYLRVFVERSAGTSEKRLAEKKLRELKQAIERGDFRSTDTASPRTFLAAAVAYLKAGGEGRFIGPIIEMTGKHSLRDRAVNDIDQMMIDNAAATLYPNATPQTCNRQFYTPVSAVLRRAGIEKEIKRPKNWRGKRSISKLEPEQAFALMDAAYGLDSEFGLLCKTLLYTGMRIGEALAARLRDLNLDRATLYVPESKNGEARTVYLPPPVVSAFKAALPRAARPNRATSRKSLPRGAAGRSQRDAGVPFLKRPLDVKLFRFHQGGRLRKLLATAMKQASLSFPPRQGGFHLFCHTYGTWMVRYGSADNFALTRTRRWKDARSAEIYVHTEVTAEARRADMFPAPPPVRGNSGERSRRRS